MRNYIPVVLLILSVLTIKYSSATTTSTDSIFPNGSISDGQTLVSMNNKFVLGFFSPGTSSYRYVGIWYKVVPNITVVWVADRNSRIQDASGVLKLDSSGNLTISDSTGSALTLAYGVGIKDMEAAILDSGNFVLRSSTNHSNIIWQSFDSPTDTWLPEMNITVGASKDQNLLTSWKSYDSPAMGDYSFGLLRAVDKLRLYIWWSGNMFWTSSLWNGNMYSLIPDLKSIETLPISFQCDNHTCKYNPNPSDALIKISLDPSGSLNITEFDQEAQLWRLLWRHPASCDVYNICGVFGICNSSLLSLPSMENDLSPCQCPRGFARQDNENTRKGCTRKTLLQCNGDAFIETPGMQFPDNGKKMSVMGKKDCKSSCTTNCLCTAYAYSLSDGCSLWHGNLTNLQSISDGNVARTLYLRVDASELQTSRSSGHKRLWIAGVIPSVAFPIFCLVSFIWIRIRRTKGKGKQHDHPSIMTSDTIKLWESEEANSRFMMLSFSEIKNATDNFSTKKKLGEGGFGPVYKGNLLDGQDIAVKRLAANSGQGLTEFKNEILLIAKLQHRNLVGLLGCCIEGEEMVLVYEYMPNKSLDFFLFEQSRITFLDWATRINIIEGIAQGLLYLHKHSRLRIIHRDLKPSNILLDIDMNPKISDFGMAKIFDPKGTQANTRRVVGTYGYMAPEYAMAGIFSIKSDVFSYGVLLLEIISGIKNAGSHRRGNSLNLLGYVWELWKEGRWYELIDKSLHGACPENMVLRCIHVGLLCVQEKAADRPSMSEVISMITNENIALPEPKQPGFLSMLGTTESDALEGTCSLNDLSITGLDGR